MTEEIRMAVIGAGGMGRAHIDRLVKMNDVKIVAICDISENSLEKVRNQFPTQIGDYKTYDDYRNLLDKERPDAVLIATPHTLHYQMAADSLDAGANVLIEKPMVNRVVDAKALLKKLEHTDKKVALAYQRHTQSEFKYIRDKIASGDFGPVQFVNVLQQQGWKKGTKGSWRQDPVLSGGGQINDSGSHLLDILLWTTGLAPNRVSAFMDNKGTSVDINSAVTVEFVGGALGTISVVGDAAGWYEDITIWCENGTFYVRNAAAFQVQGTDGQRITPDLSELPPGSDVDTNFIRAIQGKEEIAAPPICGLRTIELTEAAWESAAAGGALTNVKRSDI